MHIWPLFIVQSIPSFIILAPSFSRVKLNKRRAKGGAGGISSAVSKLIVRNREPTDAELQLQVSSPSRALLKAISLITFKAICTHSMLL